MVRLPYERPALANHIYLGAWLVALGALGGTFIGAYLGLLPRLFASPVRVSGIAVSYDSAAAVVGGSGPFVMLLVADRFGPPGVGVLFMLITAGGLIGLALMPRETMSKLLTNTIATVAVRDGISSKN